MLFCVADDSANRSTLLPKTNERASNIIDFPAPVSPEITVNPSVKSISTFLNKA